MIDPCAIVKGLASIGAYGVNLHDDDLVPFGSSAAERDRIVGDFKRALADHGLAVPMATTNPFGQPIFKDGAFSASDSTLARPEMVGVNPEVARETMAGLSIVHGVAQAMEQGEPFHIDLNGQKIGGYDQDLRFGFEDLKQALRSAGCPDRPPRPAKPTLARSRHHNSRSVDRRADGPFLENVHGEVLHSRQYSSIIRRTPR